MRSLILALLLQLAPPLALSWQPDGLRVVWSAAEPVCLYLAGGGLPTQRVADAPCAVSGDVVLARGGDYLLSPVNRDAVELRAMSDLGRLVARAEIPGTGWRVILPLVVGQENAPPPPTPTPTRWPAILPIVVR